MLEEAKTQDQHKVVVPEKNQFSLNIYLGVYKKHNPLFGYPMYGLCLILILNSFGDGMLYAYMYSVFVLVLYRQLNYVNVFLI